MSTACASPNTACELIIPPSPTLLGRLHLSFAKQSQGPYQKTASAPGKKKNHNSANPFPALPEIHRHDALRTRKYATPKIRPLPPLPIRSFKASHSILPANPRNTAGTNPIHNKKPKKADKGEEDEEDKAFKLKQAAGTFPLSNKHMHAMPHRSREGFC